MEKALGIQQEINENIVFAYFFSISDVATAISLFVCYMQ